MTLTPDDYSWWFGEKDSCVKRRPRAAAPARDDPTPRTAGRLNSSASMFRKAVDAVHTGAIESYALLGLT